MSGFDRRITAARPDLAAASLKGTIAAERYVQGRDDQAARGVIALRKEPRDDASLETQLLFGERFTVYEEKNGWVWGQAVSDSYVGYARAGAFALVASPPTHRVTALVTPLLPAPDVKCAALDMLPLNAKLAVATSGERFLRLADGGYVYAGHVTPIGRFAADWMAEAERFIGVPYLWGGKTAAGLDCSGLIQTALEAGGTLAPRDTDMMEAALGTAVAFDSAFSNLQRGDLVFWKGHMGAMLDAKRLIHANAFAMEVSIEKLSDAVARIATSEGPVRAVKRF